MANAEVLYETWDAILGNIEAWDQWEWINFPHRFAPGRTIGECGTAQCIAGTRAIMDGLLPTLDDEVWVDPSTGETVNIDEYAAERFGLNDWEVNRLLYFLTDDPAEFKQRIDEIVAGEWRKQ